MTTLNDVFISVTELQKNTKACLLNIDEIWKKVILSNNKPKAILLSLWEFYRLTNWKTNIIEVQPTQDEIEAINNYEKSKKNWETDLVSSDIFFNSL